MKKKLVIKFWKAEKALAMQIIEQEGLPRRKEEGTVHIINCPALKIYTISLRGNQHLDDFNLNHWYFENNSERNKYLDKMVNAITDEIFPSDNELKVGEMCEVSSCPDLSDSYWHKKKLIAILPDNYRSRFITQCDEDSNNWFGYKYARPICKRIAPKIKINGEVETYTWEE